MKRKIFAALLAVMMVVSILPLGVMAGDCTHGNGASGGDWMSNGDLTHSSYCKECGEVAKEGSCFSWDGVECYMCHGSMTPEPECKHEYKGVVNTGDAHNIVCRDCGTVLDTESHKFVDNLPCVCGAIYVHEHDFAAGVTTNNDGTHNTDCSCGSYAVVKCLDNDGDGKCDSCEYQMYPSCDHEGGAWISNNDGTHTSSCACGENTTSGHCYDLGSGECFMCGYVFPSEEPECKHEYKGVVNTDSAGIHNIICRDCLTVLGAESHKFVDNRPCACGAIYVHDQDDDHEHDFAAGVTTNNDGTHNINCSCGNFIAVDCFDNDGDGKCDSCGYQKYPSCNHEGGAWTSNNDGTHTSSCACGENTISGPCYDLGSGKCYMCGYEFPSEEPECEHEYKGVVNTGIDGIHTIVCRDCLTVLGLESHKFVDNRPCACGAIYVHEHDFEAGVTSNNDGTHNVNCSCGEFVTVPCLDNDGDGKCDSCGYQKYVAPDEEHEHNYVAHSNNDGTHTSSCNCGLSSNADCFDNDGDNKCDACGYVLKETADPEPKPEKPELKPEPKFDMPKLNLRSIVIDTTEGGKTGVASGRCYGALGSTYRLAVTPDEGFEVDEVLVNGKAVEAKNGKISFVVKGNTYVEVSFAEIED